MRSIAELTTRSRMGARFRFVALLPGLVPLMLGTTGLGTDDDPDGPGPLPWRVRGKVGFTVDAAAFPDSAGRSLEVYLRIPPVTLASVRRDSTGVGRLRLSVRLASRFGARPHEVSQEIAIADTATGFGKVVLLRFPVRAGGYHMRVRLEDLFSQKRGIGYIGRKVPESSSVEGDLTVPGAQAGRDLSDLEFVWPQTPQAAGAAFQRGERASLPNPERLYGLLASEMRTEFVAHGPPASTAPWHWHARVLNGQGNVVAEQESTAAAGPRLAAMVALDLSTEPAGGYDLEVKAWQEGDKGALLGSAHFSVGWQSTTWLVDPADMEDVVHFLLSAKEEHLFARLQPGEREQFLDDFWRRRDPTPDTAENEERNAFFSRVDYANRNFGGPGKGRGMFSDMGRVFIRYGEPGEVLKQVIPTGDETLAQAIHDLEVSEDRPTGDVHQKGLGADTRAYEVWIYQGDIIAPPDTDPAVSGNLRARRRIVFLFVDEHGYGDYTLRYSTE